ncbi:MAG: hypothetical protein IKW27_03100 [Bacteroidales bacterium]|nr:hypothetical protein [Bacteroidales bacterium]
MEYDYKLDYITRLLRKIRNKRFEAYVIQRIWDLLNDDSIRFVTQQYFKRDENGEYALTDLYLPQINMIVEIDEGQHIANEHEDALRSEDIKQIKAVEGVCIERIALCDKNTLKAFTMAEVHQQIDDVVEKIKDAVEQLGNQFQPWDDELWTPEYYKRKGYFRVSDDDYIKSIDDAAAVFDTKAKHRGFLRAAGFDVPNKENVIVWCPAKDNKQWSNKLEEEGDKTFIYESNNDSQKRNEHLQNHVNKAGKETRITFFREKDDLGFNFTNLLECLK